MSERFPGYDNPLQWLVYNTSAKAFHTRSTRTLHFDILRTWEMSDVVGFMAHLGFKDDFARLLQLYDAGTPAWHSVDYVDYVPFEPEIVEVPGGQRVLNGWVDTGFRPARLPWPNVERLLLRLSADDPAAYAWLLDFLAYRIQNPERPAAVSVFFCTRPGSGKDTFFHLLERIFGAPNSRLLPPERLGQRFNADLAGKALICANEVTEINDSREALQEVLKSYVTSRTITVEAKFQAPVEVSNIATWFFFTNRPETIHLQPDDRRFSVFLSQEENVKSGWSKWVRDTFWDVYSGDLSAAAVDEVRGLYQDLLERDVSNFLVLPYENAARQALLEQGESSVTRFVAELEERGWEGFVKDYQHVADVTVDDNLLDVEQCKISKKLMYAFYRRFCRDEGTPPVKQARFSRQARDILGPESDCRHSMGRPMRRVRCFDLKAFLGRNSEEGV